MSCQQVPRLTEDPYVFTETNSTVTVYNPQVHKLTSAISTSSTPLPTTTQKQFVTQKSQLVSSQHRINQTQTHQILQQQQQQLLARINGGIPQIVNGLQKNANTQGSGGFQKQFQLQCQQQQTKLATNPTSQKKFISPPPQLLNVAETALHQTQHSVYSAAAKHSPISAASVVQTPPTTIPPPLYQKATLIPQSNLPQQVDINIISQRNHSNLNKSTIQSTLPLRTAQQQFVGMSSSSPHHIVYHHQSPLTTSNPSVINTISKKTAPQTKTTSVQNDLKSTPGSDKGVFLAPSKKDTKVLSFSTKKTLKNQSSLSQSSRAKRSYSQIAHHEALQRISSISSSSSSSTNEWHAPDSYIFDNVLPFSSYFKSDNCDDYDTAPCVQFHWLDVSDIIKSIPTSTSITREQRIELRKAQLRRQAVQNILAQKFRSNFNAKKRFICVSKVLRKFKDRDEAPPPKKCCFPACSNNALALTAYCYLHITRNTDQYLFLPCTAKFSDNSQCRIPVFDITHELPLCREHAWKRDNYNRILQEQKPKKSRKRPRSISSSRPQKRKQKRRKTINNTTSTVNSHNYEQESSNFHKASSYHQIKSNSEMNNYKISSQITSSSSNQASAVTNVTQDMLTVCENSSAYESSEDTGVGGLSESELMVGAHDVIEEIPLSDTRLLEEHDLTNVLNQLPVDAFNELFTTVQQNGPLEPTQEEQEDLERALEAVNKQVKSLQQMTGGDSAFLGDFLDVDDQMLDDTDICTEVVLNSPDTSGIDTSNILIDGSNSNSGGSGSGSGGGRGGGGSCHSTTASDIRELVQT